MNLIASHASLQSSHNCKLNTVAWVVELTYFHVIVKCESFLGGHGKARCTGTLSLRKRFLFFSLKNMVVDHVSENQQLLANQ